MASNRPLAARRAQRVRVSDENAVAHGAPLMRRTIPTFPPPGGAQRVPIVNKSVQTAAGTQRAALGEVTVNHRKNSNIPSKPSQASVAKRSIVSASSAPQRVLQPPAQTSFANRPAVRVPRASATHGKTNSLRLELAQAPVLKEEGEDDIDVDMDIEGPEHPVRAIQIGAGGIDVASEDEELHKTEVEAMVGVETAHLHPAHRPRSPTLSSSPVSSPLVPLPTSSAHPLLEEARTWPAHASSRTRAELQRIREGFVDNIDGREHVWRTLR